MNIKRVWNHSGKVNQMQMAILVLVVAIIGSIFYVSTADNDYVPGTHYNHPLLGMLNYQNDTSDPLNGSVTFLLNLSIPAVANVSDTTVLLYNTVTDAVIRNEGSDYAVLEGICFEWIHDTSDSAHILSGDALEITSLSPMNLSDYRVILFVKYYAGTIEVDIP